MVKRLKKEFKKNRLSCLGFDNALIFFVIWMCSCSSDEDLLVKGSWSIDAIHYKNYEFGRCLATNVLDFGEGLCFFPVAWSCDELTNLERNGSWKFVTSDSVPLTLIIESKNDLFKGSYRAVFEEDWEQKLLRLTLISDKTFISLRKGLFNFNQEIGKYRRIIDHSQEGLAD